MYVEQLDTPTIPDNVIKDLLEQNPDTGEYSYRCDPAYEGLALFTSYSVNVKNLDWFSANGLDKYYWDIQTLRDGTSLNAHRDDRRTHVIMYIIEPGGDNVKTCFYKQLLDKEYPVVQPIPKEELELVHEQVFQQGKWYKISVQDIHSVENLESTRLCLIRQLPDIPIDLL